MDDGASVDADRPNASELVAAMVVDDDVPNANELTPAVTVDEPNERDCAPFAVEESPWRWH